MRILNDFAHIAACDNAFDDARLEYLMIDRSRMWIIGRC